MKRRKDRNRLTTKDLVVLREAHFNPEEMPFFPGTMPRGIPLLWSPLAYALARKHGAVSTGQIWKAYRHLRELKANRDAHYRQVLIPKQSGGFRRLEIPDDQLRQEQAWICREILSRCKVSSYAFAYVKGRTMCECARIHAGHDVLIHLDIRNFFGSITEETVSAVIRKKTGYPSEMADFLAALCCAHKHLPQGGLASPVLSNMAFELTDLILAGVAAMHDCVYSRYADDIYLSGSPEDPDVLVEKIRAILQRHQFELNEGKTQIIRQGRRMRVLGLTANTEKVQVSREYRRTVRQEVYYLFKFGHLADGVAEAGGMLPYAQRLLGKVSYILQINPEDAWACQAKEDLRALLRRLQKDGDPYAQELSARRQQLRETLRKVVEERAFRQIAAAVLEKELCLYPTVDYHSDDSGFHWKWADQNGRYWDYHAVLVDGNLQVTGMYPYGLPTFVLWRIMERYGDSDRYGLWRARVLVKENLVCCQSLVEKPLVPLAVSLALTSIHTAMVGICEDYYFDYYSCGR